MTELVRALREHRLLTSDAVIQEHAEQALGLLRWLQVPVGFRGRLASVSLLVDSPEAVGLPVSIRGHIPTEKEYVRHTTRVLRALGLSREAAWVTSYFDLCCTHTASLSASFTFSEPEFLGKFYVLNEPKFFIDNKYTPKKGGK